MHAPSFTLAAALGLLAGVTSAQYEGQLKGVPGGDSCPEFTADEDTQYVSWDESTTFCTLLDLEICAEGDCGIMVDGVQIGTDATKPTEFGACADDQCTDCIFSEDVETGGQGFNSGCISMGGRPYFYMS